MTSAKKRKFRIGLAALIAVVLLLSGILIGRTLSRGDDFQVFYHVAQRFWDGVRPYDQVTYGNMVFKYPPWILPAFLPFGLLDLMTAKILWGVVEAASLFAVVLRLHRGFGKIVPVRAGVQALFLLCLFALFGSHGMTGQITLPVLALALWTDPLRARFSRFFFLAWAMSAKMTSLFPLLHARKRPKWGLAVLGCISLFVVLSLPIYVKSYDRHSRAMRVEWAKAMFSGTEDANNVRIGFTTREVQGMPSLLLRKGGLDEKNSTHVLAAILISAILLGGAWVYLSRNLPPEAQWLGWLALLPATQPLAWFHVFLFAYPVLVVGAEMAIRAFDQKKFFAILTFGLLMGAITTKTLGALGTELEFWSVKLWGTLAAIWVFRGFFLRTPGHPSRGVSSRK